MNWSNRVLLFLNLALLAGFGWFVYRDGLGAPPSGWDWKDLVTILLTAVTVILAATALFVAVLAVWGYTTIRQHAETTARNVAADIAREEARKVAATVAARSAFAAQDATSDGDKEDLTESLMEGRE